ncbi:MAG TPA: hypothetical protein VF354_01345 [Candidatus Methanoperedens sp.]
MGRTLIPIHGFPSSSIPSPPLADPARAVCAKPGQAQRTRSNAARQT